MTTLIHLKKNIHDEVKANFFLKEKEMATLLLFFIA